jgi:hypothetical protein
MPSQGRGDDIGGVGCARSRPSRARAAIFNPPPCCRRARAAEFFAHLPPLHLLAQAVSIAATEPLFLRRLPM